ncbi:hypothetical protein BDV33DRAFT_211147 [Aspergillus novoparasiticus]|uniref:Uncharacterized protein n=1 Tax=Aspergillus novoparasiticus TaxID=986946 RepID=A0A5N6E4Z9_9EURO|nr:hypothetical protein BDV33DRAFT_211147 [Aspergillus novoparasiticus]
MRYSLSLMVYTILSGTWASPTPLSQDVQVQKLHYPRSPQGWIGEGIPGFNPMARIGNEGDGTSIGPGANNGKPDMSLSSLSKETGNDSPEASGSYLGNSAYGDPGDYRGNDAYGDSGAY